jgi:hypothetical protein
MYYIATKFERSRVQMSEEWFTIPKKCGLDPILVARKYPERKGCIKIIHSSSGMCNRKQQLATTKE